tara:strand:+ start:348 stop:1190 length:843 start_codon:yes stop_codon:yes gene_type:complete
MPYIGRDLSQGNYLKLDDISSQFNGSKVSFDLKSGGTDFFPGSSMALMVSVSGIIQEAETAFTIDQSSIEFASAPASGDDCFIIVLGTSIGVSVPADASVTLAKLAESAKDRLSSVGIQSGGTTIGTGVTFINFVQSGLTATSVSGIATVNLGGKTNEEIQDIVGAMFSGNTETNITVTYQDSDGTIDLEVAGGGKFVTSSSPAAGIHTASNVGVNTVGFTTDMVGAGNSFQGMYISNGMTIYDNELNGNHYISTSFNGLMAGPVTVNGVLTVDGNYVVV